VPPNTPTAAPEPYHPSGRVHVERSLVAWGILFALAVALASWQRDAIEGFGSFPFVTSGLWGLLGFGLAWLAVRFGACRNPRLAVGLGFAVGLVAFLGGYHVDQVRRWGAGWAELDRLPGYVFFRLQTDTLRKDDSGFNRIVTAPAPGVVPSRPPSWPDRWTWLLFAFDALFLVALPALAARLAAHGPFDEATGIWLSHQRAYIAAVEEPAFLAALTEGRLADWAEELKLKPAVHQNDALIRVWFVADLNGWARIGHDVYIAFADGPRWRVTADQTAPLAELVPPLRTLQSADAEAELSPVFTGSDLVAAATVSPEWHANLNALKHRFMVGLIVNFFGNVPYLAAVLITVPIVLLFTGRNAWGNPNMLVVAFCAGIVVFVIFFLAWFRWSLTNPWANVLRYQTKHLRQAIARRDGVVFHLDDPRAVLAQVCLPMADGEYIARTEWELGYLLLDDTNEVALFEGDRHRAAIPAGAVTGFDSRLQPEMTMEGSALCILTVHARSEAGDVRIEVIAESGIGGTTYLDRGEALRVRWQHLVARKPVAG
jgi:hypothetical protein